MIQSISRLFFSVLSTKYRWLTTFKTHYIIISIKWCIVFLVTSSIIITKDVVYCPNILCLLTMKKLLHSIYAIFVYYTIPVVVIISIYIYIYRKVKQTKNNTRVISNSLNSQKRDLIILRNILILISIFLSGGIPFILASIFPGKTQFLLSLVTQSLPVAVAALCTVLLNRELRQVVRNKICRTARVMPFNMDHTIERTQQAVAIAKFQNAMTYV